MTAHWWEALFSVCRPGSPTIVCDPADNALVYELARRGYRVLVLHSGEFDVDSLRCNLREHSLSSQLMGSQVYLAGAKPSLTKTFYELWIFCAAPTTVMLQAAALALKKGSRIFWSSSVYDETSSIGTPLARLPLGLDGVEI